MVSKTAVRDGFTSHLGVIAATLGSAVGLGNIWKFPYLTGTNGGAAFIIIYLACTLLVGLPVMISELAIGRKARANAITSLQKLAPHTPWWLVGAIGVLSAFLILAFYTEVAAWVFAYIVKSLSARCSQPTTNVTLGRVHSLVSSPTQSLVWQWWCWAGWPLSSPAGVSKAIRGHDQAPMPQLFLLLLAVGIREPDAAAPRKAGRSSSADFSVITWGTVLVAMGLSFISSS
jgi:NSS family neurotransmitter:Na+ symporter